MLWTKSNDFTIDGSPMLGTAEEQELSFSDLDSSDSGRDEAGFMHREVVREKVGTWNFQYPILDKEDYHYLRTLLQGKPSFAFGYLDEDGTRHITTAYCSKYGIVVKNRRTGTFKNLKFNIIEC